MPLADLIAFAFVVALLVMSPGPNGLLITKSVTSAGRRAGFANILGFTGAFYLHGTLAILGVSFLLVQSATAFSIVKFLGAAYLCWIGVKALLEAYRGPAMTPSADPRAPRTQGWLPAVAEGFATNALNPKVSMFYLAAFPQFLTAGTGHSELAQGFLLVTIHVAVNVAWFSAMILLFARLTRAAKSARFHRLLKAVTGVVFIGFGAKLASLRPQV